MLAELFASRFLPKQTGQLPGRATGLGSIGAGLVEPANLEMSRAGRRMVIGITGAVTGIAPVQAIPTTAAQWVVWNADPSATYYLESVGVTLLAGTPGLGASLWGAFVTAPAQIGSSTSGLAVQSASLGSRASRAVIKSGVTVTSPAAPAWFEIEQSTSAIAAAAFSTGYTNSIFRRDLAGAFAIPPGAGFALAVVGPAGTTPLYGPHARWVEVETDNE